MGGKPNQRNILQHKIQKVGRTQRRKEGLSRIGTRDPESRLPYAEGRDCLQRTWSQLCRRTPQECKNQVSQGSIKGARSGIARESNCLIDEQFLRPIFTGTGDRL